MLKCKCKILFLNAWEDNMISEIKNSGQILTQKSEKAGLPKEEEDSMPGDSLSIGNQSHDLKNIDPKQITGQNTEGSTCTPEIKNKIDNLINKLGMEEDSWKAAILLSIVTGGMTVGFILGGGPILAIAGFGLLTAFSGYGIKKSNDEFKQTAKEIVDLDKQFNCGIVPEKK
jgi:hypothetical protein